VARLGAAFEARHRQQIVNETGQPVGFSLDLRQKILTRLLVPFDVRLTQAAGEALDVRERGSQLV
jgi:hypothetical protein